ncbi:hypothetical protein JXR01_03570 [Candidatus Kaiserbacteria bacterium]|nr:MAG: hypothetical protein JXR01_03570 [Candidatus Kaiserbacteria bacterium]
MLEEEQILEFQELHKQHFDQNITYEQALEEGLKLIRVVALINNIPLNFK